MKHLHIIIVFVLLFFSCSEKKSIEYSIPENLNRNNQAIALIEDMAEAVAIGQIGMQKAVAFAIEKDKSKSDSLGFGDMMAMGKVILKIQKAEKKMSATKAEAQLLSSSLSQGQMDSLNATLERLENRIGDIDTGVLGLSEEELQKLKDGGDLSFGSEGNTPETQAKKDSVETEAAYIAEQHRLHEEHLKADGLCEEPNVKSDEMSNWLGLLIMGIILSLFIFLGIKSFKKIIRRIRNGAEDVNYYKNKFKNN